MRKLEGWKRVIPFLITRKGLRRIGGGAGIFEIVEVLVCFKRVYDGRLRFGMWLVANEMDAGI